MRLIDLDATESYLLDGRYVVGPVKQGRWINRNDEIFIREGSRECVHITTELCSNCKELIIHAWTFGYAEYKYCPCCGAKMDEVEK